MPAYNEEKLILNAINFVKKQKIKSFEIIILANGCTDNTIKIAGKNADKVIETSMKGISKCKKSRCKSSKRRNTGLYGFR